jgi:hypothetical protein
MAMTYFATFLQPTQTSGNSSQFRLNAGAPIWKDKFRGDVQVNFDAEKGEFLEQRYLLGVNASCYSVALEYRDFPVFRSGLVSERNRDYQISVSLKNVGTFVDLRGSISRK